MGTNKGNLYNAKDICKGKFVDLLSPDCYPWWKFWDADDNGDTQWTYDNSVNVACFGKHDIMFAEVFLAVWESSAASEQSASCDMLVEVA